MTFHEDFEQIVEIHQSNNSTVFLGIDKKSKNKIALKMLNDEFPNPKTVARFNEEAQISQRFVVEGLRKILDKRKINNRHTLIMEYIEGKSFQELIQENKFDVPFFINIAIKACHILRQIHQNGIIHKDINPKNLLLNQQEQVYLIDLGIATVSKKEHQKLEAADKLEGTLAYISPEQTGRMNHAVDSRSDLYSLGVTFYEMLTGILPFESKDSMELVHSHIAKIPISVEERNEQVPSILSKIVMKLLEKDIYQRYQTASGLQKDLEYCQKVLKESGFPSLASLDFELGKEDISHVFQIPEKLYGREEERKLFLESFARVQAGGLELLLVSGYSGIGKTALIKELYKPVTESKAYFMTGKFEQFQRDVPYSAFISAINSLVQQIIGESERRLFHWKREILKSLGNNAGVLTEVVPSLELIIGKQESPTVLPPVENQNRFNSVLQNFFSDLSTQIHALVVFIDDWQWADLPSLNLLKLLNSDLKNQYLLFIAAYRDNEADQTHPFMMVLQEIRKIQAFVQEVKLQELEQTHILELLQDTLKEPELAVLDLANLIKNKTNGNPFFVSQFLQNLYEKGEIYYDYALKSWNWDSQKISLLPISNNVLDLMTNRIKMLSGQTQKLLQLASCIGNHFPLKLLSELSGEKQVDCRILLLEALEQGLILPYLGDHYAVEDQKDQGVYFRFLHDRVEQAANQMLDSEEFTQNQWKIGQIILQKYDQSYQSENLFDLVNYLNKGRKYAVNANEQMLLAQLNYQAGKKAKRATAYSAAYTFFVLSIEYFGSSIWETDFETAFDLHKESAEACFLQGNFELSDRELDLCFEKAQSNYQKTDIFKIKIEQLSGQGKYKQAVQTTFDAVKMFDIHLPNLDEIEQINEKTNIAITDYTNFVNTYGLDQLSKIPECQDTKIRSAMQTLHMALDCAAIGVPYVLGLIAMTMNNLSIKHGLTADSLLAFTFTAVIYGSGFKDFKKAYKIGNIARLLAEQRADAIYVLPKIYHLYGYFAYLSSCTLEQAGRYNIQAYEKGIEVGDFVYASYGIAVVPRFIFAINLDKGIESSLQAINFLQKINNLTMVITVNCYLGFAYCLQGKTETENSFDWGDFKEDNFVQTMITSAPLLLAIYKRHKIQASYLLGNYENAWTLVEHRNEWINILGGIDIPWRSEYYLYTALTVSYLHDHKQQERDQYLLILNECIAEIQLLLDTSQNFLAIFLLLKAEKSRIENDHFLTFNLYDQAIAEAQKNEMFQYVGVASERAFLFFLSQNKPEIAQLYLQKSLYAYETWGATAKVNQLKKQYADLLTFAKKQQKTNATVTHSKHTSLYDSGMLDLQTVIKASQTISKKIKLDELLKKMLAVLMENAGAERALLIQVKEKQFFLLAQADTFTGKTKIYQEQVFDKEEEEKIAINVLNTAYRTQKNVVIHDAAKENNLNLTSYIQKNKVKSILALPVVHQNQIPLLIYLEHRKIAGAFTEDRIEVLNMLSTQIAISIENSNLYDTLEQKVIERTKELLEANALLEIQHSRINNSIRYAKTVQESVLPSAEDLDKAFAEHFVIYRPKDIVSGDFYWHTFIENKHILAVADCTGHGVPGAFMSMTGNSLLDEIVKQKKIFQPSQILEMLNLAVIEAFRQRTSQNKDGMDIGILVLENVGQDSFEVNYAGAKRPLFYVEDGVLEKFAGDRRSIGGRQLESQHQFLDLKIEVKKGTIFYLSTDGFADQNNFNRQTFNMKNFVEMLSKHQHLPLKEQGQIYENILQNFMADEQQRDDITLLGIRL